MRWFVLLIDKGILHVCVPVSTAVTPEGTPGPILLFKHEPTWG